MITLNLCDFLLRIAAIFYNPSEVIWLTLLCPLRFSARPFKCLRWQSGKCKKCSSCTVRGERSKNGLFHLRNSANKWLVPCELVVTSELCGLGDDVVIMFQRMDCGVTALLVDISDFSGLLSLLKVYASLINSWLRKTDFSWKKIKLNWISIRLVRVSKQ